MDAAALPWDVRATPIEARKLARLGVERGDVVLRPAFFRQLGPPYHAVDRAICPLHRHDAPHAGCSCGFYAVPDDQALWRLGADQPDLARVDVELAGRVIEHDHGYRASDQRALSVEMHHGCARCGARADVLHQRRFGGLVPACRRCARRPMTLQAASASLGVPVRFRGEETRRAPWRRRFALVALPMLVLVLALTATAAVAVLVRSGAPLALGQLAIIGWLVTGTTMLRPLAGGLGVTPGEAARLQQRWGPLVLVLVIACDLAVSVAAGIALAPPTVS
jgi:hypothetical protein